MSFVDSDRVLAIDKYLTDDIKSRLVNGALTNVKYGDKTYGMPFLLAAGILFVNKDLFEKNGIKIPTTYDELLTAVKSFRTSCFHK